MVPYKSGGYIIIHEKPFADFVLKCDVRWEDPRCNSGIFFRVEDPNNPVHTGFEIQVMSGDKTGKHEFGAIYDLTATTKNAGKETGNGMRSKSDATGRTSTSRSTVKRWPA